MRLGEVLLAYQQKYDVEGKALAEAIGVSQSTLCRIKQGRSPDAVGLAKIIMWMCGAVGNEQSTNSEIPTDFPTSENDLEP